eukprot:GILI01055458.1.p2 GENE.GILI01055458.1~~GILI01055458.1.p2  ORF type:complete len:121 (-),score=24.91 GILI01055458.1:48-410(-)
MELLVDGAEHDRTARQGHEYRCQQHRQQPGHQPPEPGAARMGGLVTRQRGIAGQMVDHEVGPVHQQRKNRVQHGRGCGETQLRPLRVAAISKAARAAPVAAAISTDLTGCSDTYLPVASA